MLFCVIEMACVVENDYITMTPILNDRPPTDIPADQSMYQTGTGIK